MDPDRRDALARSVADELAQHLTPLLDALVAAVQEDVPNSAAWTDDEVEDVREALRQVTLGFLLFLRVGDLEAHECMRLRDVLARPLPGATAPGELGLARSIRTDLADAVAGLLGPRLTDERRRLLAGELETYLALLQPSEVPVDVLGDLDGWLARIGAEGPDILPARAEPGGLVAPPGDVS